jgi:hypothetical protein
VGILTILLLSVMLPLSYQYVEYNEYALKQKLQVDTTAVYGHGRYFWGLGTTTLKFPSVYIHAEYDHTGVIAQGGINFEINCDIYYRITQEDLVPIFQEFGLTYQDRFYDTLKTAIKNTVPLYTLSFFLQNRSEVTEVIRSVLDGIGQSQLHIRVEPGKFVIREVFLADSLISNFLTTAIQGVTNDKAYLTQDIALIEKETESSLEFVNANITIINANGISQADGIVEGAKAESGKLILSAKGKGIGELFNVLNLTDTNERKRLLEMYTIIESLERQHTPQVLVTDVNAPASVVLQSNP